MNSLSPSCSHPTQTPTSHYAHTPHHRSYHSGIPGQIETFFSPLVTWTMFLGIVLSLILILLFCTQPFTPANLSSDFHTGVEGVRELFHQNSIHGVKKYQIEKNSHNIHAISLTGKT